MGTGRRVLKGRTGGSALRVVSEGDNTTQFLFHKQNGWEGAGLGREGLGGSCRDEAVKALVCGSQFRSWFGGCGDGGTQLGWGTSLILPLYVLTCGMRSRSGHTHTTKSAKEPSSA